MQCLSHEVLPACRTVVNKVPSNGDFPAIHPLNRLVSSLQLEGTSRPILGKEHKLYFFWGGGLGSIEIHSFYIVNITYNILSYVSANRQRGHHR